MSSSIAASIRKRAFGLGGMAVANLSRDDAEALITRAGWPGLEIAAINSPASVTLSGPIEAIQGLRRNSPASAASRSGCSIWPIRSIRRCWSRCACRCSSRWAISRPGAGYSVHLDRHRRRDRRAALDAEYWWRNVREPVRFRDAIEAAARQGATLFIEIGPRPILTANITDTLREAGLDGSVMPSLVEKEMAAIRW
jgi:phthiocerol/phenolphthiocerol synthesis type-I polyketide synthase C